MVRKHGVTYSANSPTIGFIRHLHMECFESEVPANFVSYALAAIM